MFLPILTQIANTVVVSKPDALPGPSGEAILDGALNLFFLGLAGVSTIVLILQGIRYTLSSGNSEATTKARNGIIYALIGVTIATAAWSLLNFTINKVIRDTSHVGDNASLANLFGDIAGLIIFIGTIIAVIMLIIGAMRMVTSGGNPEGTKKARETIIYALIGLTLNISAGPILAFLLARL